MTPALQSTAPVVNTKTCGYWSRERQEAQGRELAGWRRRLDCDPGLGLRMRAACLAAHKGDPADVPRSDKFARVFGLYTVAMRAGHRVLELSTAQMAGLLGLARSTVTLVLAWMTRMGWIRAEERFGVGRWRNPAGAYIERVLNRTSTRQVSIPGLVFARIADGLKEAAQGVFAGILTATRRVIKDFSRPGQPARRPLVRGEGNNEGGLLHLLGALGGEPAEHERQKAAAAMRRIGMSAKRAARLNPTRWPPPEEIPY